MNGETLVCPVCNESSCFYCINNAFQNVISKDDYEPDNLLGTRGNFSFVRFECQNCGSDLKFTFGVHKGYAVYGLHAVNEKKHHEYQGRD